MLELQHRLRMLRYSLITVLSLPVLLFSSFETELSYVFFFTITSYDFLSYSYLALYITRHASY